MLGKKNKKISDKRAYLTLSELIIFFGMSDMDNRKKFQNMIALLYENEVCYFDEIENKTLPLVQKHHSVGRFPVYFAVKNTPQVLSLIGRIAKERGLDIYFFREGVSPLQLRTKFSHQFGLRRLRQKLEQLYRLNAQFIDENNMLQDLVLQNKQRTLYFLNPSERAFEVFKKKMEKSASALVLTPARIAVALGLHKGWGTHLEKQLSKMYLKGYVYFDEKGQVDTLIKKYVHAGKDRFLISSHPNAIETFKQIYTEATQDFHLTPELETLKQENKKAFYDELNASYQAGIVYQNESGKCKPLVEKRATVTNGFRLVVAPHSNAYQLFLTRLKNRIKEYQLIESNIGLTALAQKLKVAPHDSYSLKEILKMLYDEKISYLDSTYQIRPLIMKKREKYFLLNDKEALKMFQVHLKAYINSYAKQPKNYLSFRKVSSLIDEKITHGQFYEVLGKMQQEGILVTTPRGCVSPAVQQFRVKNKVLPFLNDSPAALLLFRERFRMKE